MGNVFSEKRRFDVVFVDDDPAEIRESVGFSPKIFQGSEWATLKEFANRKKIRQKELNMVFKKFLSHPEVYLRKFKIRTNDVKDHFRQHSRLMQEIADVLVPLIFMKEYKGLLKTESNDEVSFARFVIMTFMFVAQPMSDLIFDFVAILRQKLTLKLHAVIFRFNLEQIIRITTEELSPCYALSVLLEYCNPQNDQEIDVRALICMGLKYPLAFYSLVRFKVHLKRLVFGDKFWEDKHQLKSRFYAKINIEGDFTDAFESEAAARRFTARALISDCTEEMGNKLVMNEYFPMDSLESISEEAFYKVKELLGFQRAKGLILEAELPLEGSFPLVDSLIEDPEEAFAMEDFDEDEEEFDSRAPSKKTGGRRDTARSEVVRSEVVRSEVVRSEVVRSEVVRSEIARSEGGRSEGRSEGGRSEGGRSDTRSIKTRSNFTTTSKVLSDLERIQDKTVEQEFVYSVKTGVRQWVRNFVSPGGGAVLKEEVVNYPNEKVVGKYRGRNIRPTTVIPITKKE